MKVPIKWLKEYVDLKITTDEIVRELNLKTIATKEVTDKFIELDMKGYNRSDLLSIIGVAKEVSAITDSKLLYKEVPENKYIWEEKEFPELDVEIKDSDLVPFYCLAKITNLKVQPSCIEWQEKLNDAGLRPINNLTDITNLIMLEYGQPLHAFNSEFIKEDHIIVKKASDGEQFLTLDHKIRELSSDDLIISDKDKTLGIAGVMGGKESSIVDTTTSILLEAAIFEPLNIRKTSQRLSLYSEAGKRFQHGLTWQNLLLALNKAIKMYQSLGGELKAITLIGNFSSQDIKIELTSEHINKLIGVNITDQNIENYLHRLEFQLNKSADIWDVTPPYYRLDVKIDADVIEEIARMYGYEKIPSKTLEGITPQRINQDIFNRITSIKETLVNLGLTEVQSYSFYPSIAVDAADINKQTLFKVANPISSETEYLKDQLWPNLINIVSANLKTFSEISIFEVGKTYHVKDGYKAEEINNLSIAISDGTESPYERLYNIVTNLFNKNNIDVTFNRAKTPKNIFHPVRYWEILFQGQIIGFMTEIHPRLAFKLGTEKRIAIIDINIDLL